MAGKAGALGSELVEVRCADFFLPVATEFAIAKIVGEDEDHVFGDFAIAVACRAMAMMAAIDMGLMDVSG